MLYLLRWLNFHFALLICALFLGLLLSHLLAPFIQGLLPGAINTEQTPWIATWLIALTITFLYAKLKGTYKLTFWRGVLVGKGGTYLLLAHLGPILAAAAIAAMVKAGSASGVVLAPLIIWSGAFYAKGFGVISEVAKTRALNKQP